MVKKRVGSSPDTHRKNGLINMAAHRYWRLYITAANSASYVELSEVEFRQVVGTPETPTGGIPLYSTQYNATTYAADKAFDGSTTTAWSTANGAVVNSFIGYDYGAGNSIEALEIAIRNNTNSSYTPKDFHVEYSDDGIVWFLAAVNWSNQIGWGNREQRIFTFVVPQSEAIRTTQLPIMMVDNGSRVIRVTQLPIQIITLPAQPARVTQLPLLTPYIPRPVPFPNVVVPEMPLDETWEWLTTVNIKDNGREQRSALREVPRVKLKVNAITLDELDRRGAYDILWKYQGKIFSWPMYQYGAFLQAATQGSTTLYFNPALTDLRLGEMAALFDPHTGETHYFEIDSLSVDGCELTEPLPFDVGRGWQICPAVASRMTGPGSLIMGSVSGDLRLDLENMGHRDFQRVDGSSLLTAYDGYVVLDRRPLVNADNEYSRNVNWVDSGTSIPLPEVKWRMNFSSGKRSFNFNRYQDMDYWRAFADFIRGRQKSFIHPTFFDDLPLESQPALGATELVTTNIQADEYLFGRLNKYIRIERQNGAIFRRVDDRKLIYDANGDPVALRLYLNQNIGSTSGSNVISKISFAPLTRLNSDVVSLRHESLDTTITLDTRTVNE